MDGRTVIVYKQNYNGVKQVREILAENGAE